MSCENENIEYWRLVQKYTTISGVVPTIPPSQDHTDGTWADTDLYIGELFINTNDNKIWMRTEDGIHQISGTGSTGSFVGDYVPTGGGTFSGGIFSPTMSSNVLTSTLITASAFDGQIFGSSQSVFYGDGSNLTGIVVTWNGGTVSNLTYFDQPVTFGSDVILNGPITTDGDCIDFQSDVCVNGGVSASFFYGDGSNLTGIVASSSNYYTISATLSGSTIIFDRNDTPSAYSVNLEPLLGTYSIDIVDWDPINSELTITTNGGDTFTQTINEFNSLNVTTSITANQFYGEFIGTYSNDIYTTTATLYGTDLVFDRTDGGSYSVDLSSISGGGSGSVGPTGPAGATGSDGATPYMFINYNSTGLTLATGSVTLPITTTLYIGWTTGTRLRLWNDSTHYMEGVVTTAMTYPQSANIDVLIDYVVGTGTPSVWRVGIAGEIGVGATASGATQSLSQTLAYSNTTNGNNIELTGSVFSGETDYILAQGNAISGGFNFEYDTGTTWYPRMIAENGGNQTIVRLTDAQIDIMSSQNIIGVDAYTRIQTTSDYIHLDGEDLITGNSVRNEITPYSHVVSSTTPTFQGIEYASDYSANFTGQSLVTKSWVQSEITLGITDTYGTRTDRVYADASPGMRTGIVSDDGPTGATGSVLVDPDGVYLSSLDNDYNSTIEVTNEIISMKAGSTNLATDYTEWNMSLGVFYKNFVYTDVIPGADDKLQTLERSQSWSFYSDYTGGSITLFYDNYFTGAIMDYEIDFFIRSQSASGRLMTYKIRKNGYYDGSNTFYPILPTDTQKGTDPSYDNGLWDIQIQGTGVGDRYVFYWDPLFGDGYTYTITAHIKTKQKKY